MIIFQALIKIQHLYAIDVAIIRHSLTDNQLVMVISIKAVQLSGQAYLFLQAVEHNGDHPFKILQPGRFGKKIMSAEHFGFRNMAGFRRC